MHNIPLIKYLYQNGYTIKQITIITGYSTSYVSANVNNKKAFIPSMNNINADQLRRKYVMDRILECRQLRKTDSLKFTYQDECYIKLMSAVMVSRTTIRKMYNTVPMYALTRAFAKGYKLIYDFDPFGIDISKEDYDFFIDEVVKYAAHDRQIYGDKNCAIR